MKTILTLILSIIFHFSFAQKVVKVTITGNTNLINALEICKSAGKTEGFGNRNYEITESTGKITLWKNVSKEDFFCEIVGSEKDGVTTLNFRMPHTPGLMSSNWTKELKKITKHISLPEMMVSEYFDGIE